MKENIQDFLKFLEVDKKYADNTIAAYQNDLNQFYQSIEAESNGPTPENWADIPKSQITEYIDQLKASGYTSPTVARKVAAIKSFFHGGLFFYKSSKGDLMFCSDLVDTWV